jgi:hypothetical protein
MRITDGYDYAAGSHSSDTVDLPRVARGFYLYVPAAGSIVTLRVLPVGATDPVNLSFPVGFCDYVPLAIRRVYATGTANEDQSNATLFLATATLD